MSQSLHLSYESFQLISNTNKGESPPDILKYFKHLVYSGEFNDDYIHFKKNNQRKSRRQIANLIQNSHIRQLFGLCYVDRTREREISYEEYEKLPDCGSYDLQYPCIGWDCDHCNPPKSKIRIYVKIPLVIKNATDEDILEIVKYYDKSKLDKEVVNKYNKEYDSTRLKSYIVQIINNLPLVLCEVILAYGLPKY